LGLSQWNPTEPRQVRKEAAVSGETMCREVAQAGTDSSKNLQIPKNRYNNKEPEKPSL